MALGTLPGIVVDDEHAQNVGAWTQSNFEKPYVGQGYLHDAHEAGVAKTVTFEPKSLPPGNYTVRLAYTVSANRSSKTIVRVFSADGERPLTINQRHKPPIEGLWITLGEYRFEKDGQAFVLVSNEEADGHVIADAVQFLPIAPSPTPPSPASLSQTGYDRHGDSSDQGQPAARASHSSAVEATEGAACKARKRTGIATYGYQHSGTVATARYSNPHSRQRA